MVWKTDGQDRLAKCLETLIDDIDRRFPERDRHNDGTLGDARHRALGEKTDHNPHVHLNGAGIVTALDVTHDPEHGFDAQVFADSLREERDKRIKYVIFNGRIFSSTTDPWQWRRRNQGPGDHAEHVHVSVVDDPTRYDDASPWTYDVSDTADGPPQIFPPKLKRGDSGPAVVDLQTLLGIEADGDFGDDTDAAVRAFQLRNNLFDDGIVGSHTWGVLLASSTMRPAAARLDATLGADTVEAIARLAAASPLIRQKWSGSLAPRGYIKGMAVAFAQVYAKWKARDPAALVMAAGDGGKDQTDALSWYASEFRGLDMDNSVPGPATLRHLFVLLIGLGMRESGGKYNEGRDVTASNTDAETCEAGLFQMSWNARRASAEIPRLFALHARAQDDGLLSIFQEGVRARDTANFGTGEGAAYQKLCKARPLFAVETAAVALRVLRKHFGPINRREAEIRPEADALLRKVQEVVDAAVSVPAPIEIPLPGEAPVPQRPTVPAALDPMHLLLLVVAALLKEKPMQDASNAQGQADPARLILAALVPQLLSGRPLDLGTLLGALIAQPVARRVETPPPEDEPADPPSVDAQPPLLGAVMQILLQRLLPEAGITPAPVPAPKPAPTARPPVTISPVPIAEPGDATLLKQVADLIGALSDARNQGTGAASADQLKVLLDTLIAVTGKAKQLGPVNGALGQAIGRVLNGRKSAIGIFGSLASGLLEALPQVAPALVAGPIASVLPGVGTVAMPVFLAMTAWGFLGKLEKWTGAGRRTA